MALAKAAADGNRAAREGRRACSTRAATSRAARWSKQLAFIKDPQELTQLQGMMAQSTLDAERAAHALDVVASGCALSSCAFTSAPTTSAGS